MLLKKWRKIKLESKASYSKLGVNVQNYTIIWKNRNMLGKWPQS
jgi:hypothetical protein